MRSVPVSFPRAAALPRGIGALLRTPFNQSNPFLGLRGMVSTPDAHSQGGMSVSEAFHPQGGMSVSEAFPAVERQGEGRARASFPDRPGAEHCLGRTGSRGFAAAVAAWSVACVEAARLR